MPDFMPGDIPAPALTLPAPISSYAPTAACTPHLPLHPPSSAPPPADHSSHRGDVHLGRCERGGRVDDGACRPRDHPPPGTLVDLAWQLPPAVLASLLGMHPATAVRWSRRIASDWTAYLGAVTWH